MDSTGLSAAASRLAERIREARDDLSRQWLELISRRMAIPAEKIFPSDELIADIPLLLVAIADSIEDPTDEITSDLPVAAKAMELGRLRFNQGFDAGQILKEYELLGALLFAFARQFAAESEPAHDAVDMVVCTHRIFRAIAAIEQVTTTHFLRALAVRVGEREEQLRRFNRMITHELKNRVGATLGAGQLLNEEWLGDDERRRFASMITDNAQAIQKVLENLVALSRIDGERRRQRNSALRDVVSDVFRQLHDLAVARDVELRVSESLPDIDVNAAAVELCLSNYLSNAIKYSDGSAPVRWAEITAGVEEAPGRPGQSDIVVRVRDNGIGVPPSARPHLFERFFRAHGDSTPEGTGLGLNLVLETVQGLGGRAWAEFDQPTGSIFAFSLPCRRDADTAARVSDAPSAEKSGESRPRDAARVTASD